MKLRDLLKKKDFWIIITSFCMVIVTIVLVYVTWTAAKRNIAHERKMQSIELLTYFQTRWDNVTYDMKHKINDKIQTGKNGKVDSNMVKSYYYRYWDLQLQQYEMWRRGLVDDKIYSSWMDWRNKEWHNDESLGEMTYQAGWYEFIAAASLEDSKFAEHMEKQFDKNDNSK